MPRFVIPITNNQTGEQRTVVVDAFDSATAQETALVHMFQNHGWRNATATPPTGATTGYDPMKYGRSGTGIVVAD